MELVIFIGLQGAGKSSFYRTRFADSHALVSKDRFRNNRRPGRRQRHLIDGALQAGQSVVVDNTNPTVHDRAELIELARGHGATVVGYYFESRLEHCLERNRLRIGKERVPEVGLVNVAKKLEWPDYSEGFDRLYYVRLAGDQKFVVQEWADAPKNDETH
ncbi:kinase [Planctomycetaceae bacterium SCGC AG-212-F19]|nr:kinase [Planctomycetaceae bacterium SCGC AG-212-F19]